MHQLAARLVRINPKLRGLKIETEGRKLTVILRVAGVTRFYIQGDARNLILKFVRSAGMRADAVKLMQVVTEPSRRDLYAGEGRTEMVRRPRAQLKADGTPWDDIAWWGDELPGSPVEGVDGTDDRNDSGGDQVAG